MCSRTGLQEEAAIQRVMSLVTLGDKLLQMSLCFPEPAGFCVTVLNIACDVTRSRKITVLKKWRHQERDESRVVFSWMFTVWPLVSAALHSQLCCFVDCNQSVSFLVSFTDVLPSVTRRHREHMIIDMFAVTVGKEQTCTLCPLMSQNQHESSPKINRWRPPVCGTISSSRPVTVSHTVSWIEQSELGSVSPWCVEFTSTLNQTFLIFGFLGFHDTIWFNFRTMPVAAFIRSINSIVFILLVRQRLFMMVYSKFYQMMLCSSASSLRECFRCLLMMLLYKLPVLAVLHLFFRFLLQCIVWGEHTLWLCRMERRYYCLIPRAKIERVQYSVNLQAFKRLSIVVISWHWLGLNCQKESAHADSAQRQTWSRGSERLPRLTHARRRTRELALGKTLARSEPGCLSLGPDQPRSRHPLQISALSPLSLELREDLEAKSR